jgi:hypothetical protein
MRERESERERERVEYEQQYRHDARILSDERRR